LFEDAREHEDDNAGKEPVEPFQKAIEIKKVLDAVVEDPFKKLGNGIHSFFWI